MRSNRLPILAAEIKRAHNKAGKLLIEAKVTVPHGRWLDWLRDNCDMPELTGEFPECCREGDSA